MRLSNMQTYSRRAVLAPLLRIVALLVIGVCVLAAGLIGLSRNHSVRIPIAAIISVEASV